MSIRVTNDAAEFRDLVFPFLQADPVLNTILLSYVSGRAERRSAAEPEPSYYVSVHDEAGAVIGATMRTPGRMVLLGGLPVALAGEVAAAYAELVPAAPGVAGSAEVAAAFAEHWSARSGITWRQQKAIRLHKLEELVGLAANGRPRLATAADVQLVADWVVVDFGQELTDPVTWARTGIADRLVWLWEVDGVPVSMVARRPAVFGVARIGPVYTPDEHRRNGYAGALTAYVSGEILAEGNQACLFTDLDNPTSNKIYHAAGYRPVADFVELAFR